MFIDGILVPVDFSERSEAQLKYAVDLARVCGARVEVLHVAPEPQPTDAAANLALGNPIALPAPAVLASARAQMDALVAATPHNGVTVDSEIELGSAAEIITRVAAERAHDLIVVGMPGKVASEVMSHAPCPILTCRGA
jgi:nucleotide-binding universal stress UspA family protein